MHKTLSASLILIVAYALPLQFLDAQSLPVATPDQRIVLETKGATEVDFSHPGSPNIVRATTTEGQHVDVSFNKDASKVTLAIPAGTSSQTLDVLTTDESQQFSDGTIVFSALDAEVHGDKAKLESNPGSHRIGFWSNENDYVTWSFKPRRWGRYSVELLYSQAGKSGNEINATFASASDKANMDQSLTCTLNSTTSWYTYRVAELGELYIDDQNFRHPVKLTVGCKKKVSNAVMNLKAVLLRPKCEGNEIADADSNSAFTFLAKDATVLGLQLVYEPNPKKNTLGWWVVSTDKVRWNFKTKETGNFSVNVLQGCGEGQGGSRIAIEVLKANAPTFDPADGEENPWLADSFEFQVEDTGDFQNYKRRTVGNLKLEPGKYVLQVRPLSIADKAAMDLKEVVLTPVNPE